MPEIFTDEQRTEILDYLVEELDYAEQEKAKKRDKWDKWRRQREGLPEHEVKEYPFPKSANVSVPLSVSNHNTLYGAAMNMFADITPFWTISAMRKDNSEDFAIAEVLTRYFDLITQSPTDLDKAGVDPVINYEGNSMGVCFVKVPYTQLRYTSRMFDGETGTAKDVEVTIHDGPEIVPIPIEDMFYREAYKNLQTAPWIAHRIHHTWPEMQQLQEQGLYENVDELETWARKFPELNEQRDDARMSVFQQPSEVWDVYEVYVFWLMDGVFRDCLLTIHKEAKIVLREDYNPLGRRPIEPFIFLLRPFRLDGLGVGHLSEHMQDEVDTYHNYRIDSLLTSIAPMLAIRKQGGQKNQEKVYPGKIWFMDDPQKEWAMMQFPAPAPWTAEVEGMSIMYSQKAVGANDAMGGFADLTVKTRDSPGLQNQRLKQGTGVFSAIMETRKKSYSRVGELILYQLILNKDFVLDKERRIQRLSADEITLLDKALSIPASEIPARLRFSVRTSDVEQTFEGKRQNLLTLTQLYALFFQRTFPIAQMLFSPQGQMMMQQAPEMYRYLLRIYTGSCKQMEETIKFFGEPDAQKYVPDYKRQEMIDKLFAAFQGGLNEFGQVPPAFNAPAPAGLLPGLGGGPQAGGAGATPGGIQGAQGGGPQGGGVPGVQVPA